MSDMEDDFMCDDEEDYDLVLKTEFTSTHFYTHVPWALVLKYRASYC